MPLLAPWFTTTNLSPKKKKGKLLSNYEKWLLRNGVHPTQIKNKKTPNKNWKKEYRETLKVEGPDYPSSGLSGIVCTNKSIMANLHKESPEVQKAIREKATRIAPAYNKGGLQYITDQADIESLGKKK